MAPFDFAYRFFCYSEAGSKGRSEVYWINLARVTGLLEF